MGDHSHVLLLIPTILPTVVGWYHAQFISKLGQMFH